MSSRRRSEGIGLCVLCGCGVGIDGVDRQGMGRTAGDEIAPKRADTSTLVRRKDELV